MEKYIRHPNCACSVCNKEIYRRPKQISSGKVYCSNECFGKSNEVLIKCAICENLIPSGKNKKTCSRACANKQKEGLKYKKALGRPIKDKAKDLVAVRNRLVEKFGYACMKCAYSKMPILEVHHILERSKGGTDDLDNLQLICPNCHAEEHYVRRNTEA